MGWYERYNARRRRHPLDCPCGHCKRAKAIEPSKLKVPEPTTAEPGSDEKIQIMRERLEQGFHLHSPEDVGVALRPYQVDRIVEMLDQMGG